MLTQELRREQAYLSDAHSLAHIGSWAYNLITGQLVHSWNENARLYGFDPSRGPLSAERFFATQHVDDKGWITAALEKAVREGADFYLPEYRIWHTDGSLRFLRAIGRRNASGEPVEYVGVTMDITERKRAEEERERLRQLEASLAHINRVNMMGELTAALAHEIKQPIAASVTSANALLRWLAHDPPDLEGARAAATRVDQEGNRAADMINSLRAFYKTGAPGDPIALPCERRYFSCMTPAQNSLVAILDDDESIRQALLDLVESERLGALWYDSAENVLVSKAGRDASCLICDIRMPGISGLELQETLKSEGRFVPIIFITGLGDIPMAVRAMREGAIDFLTKPVDDVALLGSVERAFHQYRENRREVSEYERFSVRYKTLTPREREVLSLLVRGLLNKQAGFELGITEYTVQIHRAHIMQKMEAASFATLVKLASKFGSGPSVAGSSPVSGVGPIITRRSPGRDSARLHFAILPRTKERSRITSQPCALDPDCSLRRCVR